MWLTLLAVAVGLISGLVAGGSLAAIGTAKLRAIPLAALWVGLTVVTRWAAVPQGRWLFLLANLCALSFCVFNARRLSMWLLFAGFALNTVTIALNGAMPYRVSAIINAELATTQDDFPVTVQSRPERETDRLKPLGDIIAIHAGPIKDVLSIGDVLAAFGMAWVVYRLTQTKPPSAVKTKTAAKRVTKVTPNQQSAAKSKPVSTLKIGEEHDLDDDVEFEPVTSSSGRLLLDLTADRGRHSDRYHDSSTAAFEDLMNAAATGDEVALLDITTGEVPGDTFWYERAVQRSRDARAQQNGRP
jgi:Family of unknown function (DUF5317)